MKQFLELGKINNTHGIKGEVKVALWCDDINYVKQLKTVYLDSNGKKPLTLVSARPQKNIGILKFAEITVTTQKSMTASTISPILSAAMSLILIPTRSTVKSSMFSITARAIFTMLSLGASTRLYLPLTMLLRRLIPNIR